LQRQNKGGVLKFWKIMANFEILPHTADVRLKIFGKTKKELFKNAVLGMAKILESRKQKVESRKQIKTKVNIKSQDINSLLVDFLSEILYQSQINHAVYREIKLSKFSDDELEGEISGFKIEKFDEDIKAVTYHELDIKKNPLSNLFETIIIFDI
jgi:SHS2 domain-containing protein